MFALIYAGCNLYGMGVAFFGLDSIVTLSTIACERYLVIKSSSCRPAVAKWHITHRQARKVSSVYNVCKNILILIVFISIYFWLKLTFWLDHIIYNVPQLCTQ